LEITARAKGLQTIVDFGPDVPERVIADSLRLKQVLVNLIGNAIKFTEKGHIQIILERVSQPEGLRFRVRDTGIGIPSDKQEQVFSAFTQADGSIARKYGGTGLGLTISLKLIHLMGGTIRLESEPDKGTTFEFVVPCQSGSLAEVEETRAVPARTEQTRALRILLAEDNPVNQKVASRLLERRGHSVLIAGNGQIAADAAGRETFDLILMDVQMPGMDGFQATAAIRETETGKPRRTPIIAMTAHAMVGDRERCLSAGMDGYVPKPLQPADLFQVIATIMEKTERETGLPLTSLQLQSHATDYQP
jgi:CheY-like chemotaxis protein/anti-sigma regulatory factor (Ser/Thr protein kinase)